MEIFLHSTNSLKNNAKVVKMYAVKSDLLENVLKEVVARVMPFKKANVLWKEKEGAENGVLYVVFRFNQKRQRQQ